MKNKNKKPEYVKTGNLPVDMIYHMMLHYKKQGIKIKEIMLSHAWWETFTAYLKDKAPEMNITNGDTEVHFNNLKIKKGHRFMTENLQTDLYLRDKTTA